MQYIVVLLQMKNLEPVMIDVNCLFAGLTRLLSPLLLLLLWRKKTGARFYPALIAFSICVPVFIIGAAIRSGFSYDVPIAFYIRQGLLYGILEEGAKYLVLRFLLTAYDSRKDAVTYGIGHGFYENFGAGMSCLGLIGTDTAAPNILWFNLWAAFEGAVSCIAFTVLIFYGIRTGKSKVMLPIVILLHAVSNAVVGICSEPVSILTRTLLTAGACFAAYRCWQAMWTPYEDAS